MTEIEILQKIAADISEIKNAVGFLIPIIFFSMCYLGILVFRGK